MKQLSCAKGTTVELYLTDWGWGHLWEYRDFGFDVWMLGPLRIVRRRPPPWPAYSK